MKNNRLPINESGQVFVIILIVLGLIVLNTLLIIGGSVTYLQATNQDIKKNEAINLAEAGIDKAVASLNATAGTYNGEPETTLGDGSYSVSVTSLDASSDLIQSTGYIPNKTHPVATRTIKIQVSKGNGINFSYGVLVGQGGLDLSGGSHINGSVYSNGNIDLSGGGVINGNAWVAGGTQSTADQQSDCTAPNCADYEFGRNSGNSPLDVAQSFQPTATQVINKVSLKLRKVGSPANITVRILGNNGTNPDKNNVLASGTLTASLVTGSYGFIDVTLTTNPTLTAGTTYWVMIDTSNNSTNYWQWSNNTLAGYTSGQPKWSSDWNTGHPTWNNIAGDLGFKTYMGGVITHIAGVGSSDILGSAYANTLSANVNGALRISQQAYYQTVDSNVRVNGQACPNSNCHSGQTDPPPQPLPISDANITDWETQAQVQGTTNGNLNIGQPCTTVLKGYITGNVSIANGCSGNLTINMETPVYIHGNFSMGGGAVLRLKPSYGAQSGVIIVDGTVNLAGGTNVTGSGDPNSLMLVLSTYPSPGGAYAITTGGGNISSVLYANNGWISVSGGGTLYEVVGQRLVITGGGTVNYQSGIPTPQLPAGPSGSFSVIKGTYQLK